MKRKTPLVNGEYYHLYNRGVARGPTFLDKRDYTQGMLTLSYYRFAKLPLKLSRLKELPSYSRNDIFKEISTHNKLVDIISFVLMPNHFHFLLKQNLDNGISTFLGNFTNSYTKYFNTKKERVGPLFQGIFKSVHIETTKQLVHVSRYIHLNPLTSFVVDEKDFLSYQWSSFLDYIEGTSTVINPEPILLNFQSIEKYKQFVLNQKDYQIELKQIEHLRLEK